MLRFLLLKSCFMKLSVNVLFCFINLITNKHFYKWDYKGSIVVAAAASSPVNVTDIIVIVVWLVD